MRMRLELPYAYGIDGRDELEGTQGVSKAQGSYACEEEGRRVIKCSVPHLHDGWGDRLAGYAFFGWILWLIVSAVWNWREYDATDWVFGVLLILSTAANAWLYLRRGYRRGANCGTCRRVIERERKQAEEQERRKREGP